MAFVCYLRHFFATLKDKHRVEHLKQIFKFDDVKATKLLPPKVEEEWCSFHYLVQSSLNHVSEICVYFCSYIMRIFTVVQLFLDLHSKICLNFDF